MSFLMRQLCMILVVVVVINCSQGFSIGYGSESEDSLQDRPWDDVASEEKRSDTPLLRIGRSLHLDTESVLPMEEEELFEDTDKRAPHMKIGKREGFLRIGRKPSDSVFLRIGRSPFLRVRKSPFLRIGRSPFLRIGRSPFLRIGRSPFLRIGRSPFLRIGKSQNPDTLDTEMDRRSNGQTFLRIGRGSGESFLRIGRGDKPFAGAESASFIVNDDILDVEGDDADDTEAGVNAETAGTMTKRGLRIGKRILGAFSEGGTNELTLEELQLLKENKELLLQYMESHPELFDGNQNRNDDAYFAFPRQGRAMSFYFPRMGRSGDDDLGSPYCCEEGVRKVYKIGKDAQELCANEKPCCPGFVEQEKVYKDIIITECAVKIASDKFRNYISDE